MPVAIPLPRYDTLPEGVYLHRRFKGDVRVFILQVPDADRSDSETYILDLTKTVHASWVEGLKNSRNLLSVLQYAEHVAYCPRTGHFEEMPDLDEVSQVTQTIALARKDASETRSIEHKLSAAHRQKQHWGQSKLRIALGGGHGTRRRFR
jgi:hypothetical protein